MSTGTLVLILLAVLTLHVVLSLWAIGHALLNKENPRSVMGWAFFLVGLPLLGPLFYRMFGINRVQRRAMKLLNQHDGADYSTGFGSDVDNKPPKREPGKKNSNSGDVKALEQRQLDKLLPLANSCAGITGLALTHGNQVELLHCGTEAFPAMLEEIEAAEHYVLLQSYIFAIDNIGQQITNALLAAQERGVEVRVLIDGMGEWQQLPITSWKLRRKGISVARFIPIKFFLPPLRVNLRNHRKLLVVDGKVAFTGGVNVIDDHWPKPDGVTNTQDIHFRVRGPVCNQLQSAFAADWEFACQEPLKISLHGTEEPHGETLARVITDVPVRGELGLLRAYIAAINAATDSIRIFTPYFLPPEALSSALSAAALRGVRIDIIVPSKIDHKVVEWGCQRFYSDLYPFGIRLWQQPPPFAHTKMLVVDQSYALVGSCNLDPRSLELNFEMNIELYDGAACKPLIEFFDERLEKSTALQPSSELSTLQQLKCSLGWMLSPYL